MWCHLTTRMGHLEKHEKNRIRLGLLSETGGQNKHGFHNFREYEPLNQGHVN